MKTDQRRWAIVEASFAACVIWLMLMASAAAEPLKIASLPDIVSAGYRVEPYLIAANQLQSMGRRRATRALAEAAHRHPEDQQVILLCRMLFVKHDGREFRRPEIGDTRFFGGTDYADWPLEPIEIVDGIPFLIVRSYRVGGEVESAEEYLEYCQTHCDWNPVSFRPATREQKRAALTKFLASKKWKEPLDRINERDFLTGQIE